MPSMENSVNHGSTKSAKKFEILITCSYPAPSYKDNCRGTQEPIKVVRNRMYFFTDTNVCSNTGHCYKSWSEAYPVASFLSSLNEL